MPWNCCGVQLVDNVRKCPSCGTSKANWTVRFEATRRLVLGGQNEWEVVEEVDEEEPSFELLEELEEDEEEDFEVVEDEEEGEEFEVVEDSDLEEEQFELLVDVAEEEVEEHEVVEEVDEEEPTYELLEEAPKQKEQVRARTWVAVVLQDPAGVPLVGARCKLTFEDGSDREERTGQGGLLRLDGVPAGNVVVTFPDHPLTMKVS